MGLERFTSYLSYKFQVTEMGHTTPLSKAIGMHCNIKFCFYADDIQLFIHMSYKNAALAFDKLNSCLLGVQEWMSSSMLKLNPDLAYFDLMPISRN